MIDIEQDIIPTIAAKAAERSTYFRKVRDGVYLTRCPWCGDSSSQLKTGHLYLLITDNHCQCYCHKCNTSKSLDNETLKLFIGENNFNLSGQKKRVIRPGNSNNNVETHIPPKSSAEYRYLKWRIGTDFSSDELMKFRIIDQEKYLTEYNIGNLEVVPNAIAFVTPDGNTVSYRCMTENDQFRWMKRCVNPKYESTPYVMRGSFDMLSTEPQSVIITEGIFDIIGVYKHITDAADMYCATLGKDHSRTINWLISKGIIGRNIEIQIYSDNDVLISTLRKQLSKFRWIYQSITVVYNDADHDFGVTKDHIITRDPLMI